MTHDCTVSPEDAATMDAEALAEIAPRFTPGPWQAVESEHRSRYIIGSNRVYVATVESEYQPPRMEYRAPRAQAPRNATLIAAAPDLLAALEALTEWACTHTGPHDANSPHELLIQARAALAKATGGKP